ncbi:MAG TPA: hypothetical protein VK357_16165, partial [Rubrobacteraceae bacterium]|nr:hypothetical protein [Rubrobacteraceae bacterium]
RLRQYLTYPPVTVNDIPRVARINVQKGVVAASSEARAINATGFRYVGTHALEEKHFQAR